MVHLFLQSAFFHFLCSLKPETPRRARKYKYMVKWFFPSDLWHLSSEMADITFAPVAIWATVFTSDQAKCTSTASST